MFKTFVALTLLAIIGSLFSGLWFLYQDNQEKKGGNSRRTAKALSLRISLSIGLFLVLLISYHLGKY